VQRWRCVTLAAHMVAAPQQRESATASATGTAATVVESTPLDERARRYVAHQLMAPLAPFAAGGKSTTIVFSERSACVSLSNRRDVFRPNAGGAATAAVWLSTTPPRNNAIGGSGACAARVVGASLTHEGALLSSSVALTRAQIAAAWLGMFLFVVRIEFETRIARRVGVHSMLSRWRATTSASLGAAAAASSSSSNAFLVDLWRADQLYVARRLIESSPSSSATAVNENRATTTNDDLSFPVFSSVTAQADIATSTGSANNNNNNNNSNVSERNKNTDNNEEEKEDDDDDFAPATRSPQSIRLAAMLSAAADFSSAAAPVEYVPLVWSNAQRVPYTFAQSLPSLPMPVTTSTSTATTTTTKTAKQKKQAMKKKKNKRKRNDGVEAATTTTATTTSGTTTPTTTTTTTAASSTPNAKRIKHQQQQKQQQKKKPSNSNKGSSSATAAPAAKRRAHVPIFANVVYCHAFAIDGVCRSAGEKSRRSFRYDRMLIPIERRQCVPVSASDAAAGAGGVDRRAADELVHVDARRALRQRSTVATRRANVQLAHTVNVRRSVAAVTTVTE
jgi:hypothetical protein